MREGTLLHGTYWRISHRFTQRLRYPLLSSEGTVGGREGQVLAASLRVTAFSLLASMASPNDQDLISLKVGGIGHGARRTHPRSRGQKPHALFVA